MSSPALRPSSAPAPAPALPVSPPVKQGTAEGHQMISRMRGNMATGSSSSSALSSTLTERSWDKSGKQEFLRQCKSSDDRDVLRQLFYEFSLHVINGNLRPESLVSAFAEVITVSKDAPNILTDVLLLCDIETQTSENKDQRDQFLYLLSTCSNRVVSDTLLKERLDYDTTGDARIIPNKKSAQTKFIKLKTRLFYKQQKFNLFREESEGYAKLITELCQNGTFDCEYMLQVIRSLIGCFNLDPNRVLDVILECFECRPHLEGSYIPLLNKFLNNSSTLSQILAFKFGFYQNDVNVDTPESLYEVTALVLSNHLIELSELYPYLTPNDVAITEQHKIELAEAKAIAKRISIIATSEEKISDENKLSESERHSLFNNNQKLGLCSALLKVGNWKDAKELINKLPDYYAIANPSIAKELSVLINYAIDKFYRENSGLPPAVSCKLKPYKAENIRYLKPAETVAELKHTVFPMVSAIGAYLHQDSLLVSKLIRLGKSLLLKKPEVKGEVLNMLDEAILPAVSLIDSNCGLSEELWQLMKTLSYQHRYRLYYGWKSEPNNALLIKTRAATLKRIKYIMKRLSKENVKLSGRQIGKLSHSNPSYLFEYILSQIQSYDNLIGPVVDSLKYLTALSYDVLVFCIIEALANPSKDRTKHDGATISPWLLSLANFCGSVVKKYAVELPGLLQFVANQLKAEKSLDLLVLKEIVQKMAGIEASEEMTNEQLAAMSGGELLRAEGGYFNQVRNTKKSSMRLKDALLEYNLAMPLCILMAQQRNCILFHEQEHSHLKLVGKLYDQETLVQYGYFLSSILSIDDYIGRLPSLEKLITEYNLSADIAFFLVRPMIVHNITLKFEELKSSSSRGDRPSKSHMPYIEAWESVTKPIVDSVQSALSSKFWDDLSPRFFVTFWTLSMYDLEVPKTSYEKEVDRLKNQIQQTEENKDLVGNKKKKEVERWRLLQEKLLEEQLKQDDHVRRVKYRLEKEKDQWFQSKLAKMEMTTQFLQHCLFPRCTSTASDALYCAKFVHLLHTLKTPNFSTLICYDRIFGDISYTMCSCTENEANHYGRFLCALLDTVMRWHKDKAIFEKECAKYPGFVTKFCEKDPVHVDYENYRHVCHKWHYRLTKAFILCLDSGDYIQIRNSLIVLTKILQYFPVMLSFAQAIERRVENIRTDEKDKRPDLYALATGYAGQLKLRKSSFVPESEFHLKESKKVGQQSAKAEGTAGVKKEATGKTESNATPNNKSTAQVKKERDSNSKSKTSESIEVVAVVEKKREKSDPKGGDSTKTPKRDLSEKSSKVSSSERTTLSNEKTIKSELKSVTTTLSPRKSSELLRGRSVEPVDVDREHKRRKIDKSQSQNHDDSGRERERNDTHERRKGDDSTSSSPSNNLRPHDIKKSSRKRELNDESPSETSKRRRGDDEIKSKKGSNVEEREPNSNSSRKTLDTKRGTNSSSSTSSRRAKLEDK